VAAAVGHHHQLPEGMHVLPWHTEGEVELDLTNSLQVESHLDAINKLTDDIDSEDPWVLTTFGIRGPGEGLVWYPVNVDLEEGDMTEGRIKMRAVSTEVYGGFSFKTKGEKHRVVVTKKAAQVKPEKAENATKYVELMLPEARLQQGKREHTCNYLLLPLCEPDGVEQACKPWAAWRRRTSQHSSSGSLAMSRRRARMSWPPASSSGSRCRP